MTMTALIDERIQPEYILSECLLIYINQLSLLFFSQDSTTKPNLELTTSSFVIPLFFSSHCNIYIYTHPHLSIYVYIDVCLKKDIVNNKQLMIHDR